jgi:hypothetical protein
MFLIFFHFQFVARFVKSAPLPLEGDPDPLEVLENKNETFEEKN